MISLDDLRSSVDLYRGCVSFSLPLCSLMGGAGPQFDLAIQYDGSVTYDATTWNMAAPTGVLGLGWNLPLERIAVRFDHNTAPADQEIILTTANGSTRLLQTGQLSADVLTYAAEDYRFWKIQRFLSTERWEITREDGVKYVYGDIRSSSRSTVEFGVCWANWIGSSANLDEQEPIAVAWDLSQIVDLWDNTITFKYRQVVAPVGSATGRSYTQAVYLDEIEGAAGDRVAFHYGAKETKEYQNPHTNPAPPNAWQDRFEKEFLDRMEIFSPTAEEMYTVKFEFTDTQGGAVFLGSGPLTKRLLMGVKRQYPGARNDLPDVRFTYVMSASDPAYGSIATVTTPAGGVTTYSYTGKQDLALCDRTNGLTAPSGAVFSQPRFWFEDNYVVVTWLGDNQQAQIMAYAWEGRWLESKLGSLAVPTANDYANLQVQTAKSNFAVIAGTHALAYYRDVTSPGSWISSDVLTLDLNGDDPIVTTAGDGFAAVLGQKSGKLNRIRFSGTVWVADMVVLSGGGATGLQCSMAGKHNFIFSASVLGNDSSDRLHLRIDYLDALSQWQTTSFTNNRTQTTITSLTVYTGDTYAVVVSTAPLSGLVQYAYTTFFWSSNFDNLQSKLLLQFSSATTPAPPELHGAFVGIGQQLFRFDGKKWGQQNVASIAYPNQQAVTGISYGFDQTLRTISKTDGPPIFDLIVYNPNQSETATPWSVPANMGSIAPGAGNFIARAARSDDNQSNYVLLPVVGTPSGNAIYYQQPAGSWVRVLQIPDSPTATELGTLQVLDELYCIYQLGANTIVYPLQNGAALGRITVNGQLLVPNASPTMLIGQQSFVTYTGNWGEAGSTITLHRVVRQGVAQKLQVFAVNTLQQDTGYQSVPGAQGSLLTAYAFERSNATIDVEGYKAAYNLATVAENASDVTNAPQGTTATSFFNNLRLNEAPVTPAYPTNPDPQHIFTNATQFLRLLRGSVYATEMKSSISRAPAVAASSGYWFVFTQSLTAGGERGFYRRTQKFDTTLNQVPGTVETTFDTLTGLPKQITTYQFNSLATKDTLVTNLTYWWEQYNHNRDMNLLTPIIETIDSTNGVATANRITTWSSDWGFTPEHWAQFATYTATTPTPQAFNKFTPNNNPLAPGWLLQTQVVERNAHGLLLRAIDGLGLQGSTVLDSSGELPVASFFNANIASREAGYYGFEVYEDNVAWSYTGGLSINEFIISGSFHTGSRCLQIASDPGGTIGPISNWLNTNSSRSFVFSCWMLVPAGSNASSNNAFWSIQVETVGPVPVSVGPEFKLAFPAATGKWIYIHHLIDLGKYRAKYNPPTPALQITIKGVNKSNNFCLVDELRFSAVDGIYSALVYDSSLRLVTAVLGENGVTMRPVQDVYDRECALIGPDENVADLIIPAFSRMQSADKNFDPQLPNSELLIKASSDGLYYDFDPSDIPDWTLPANWTIAAGQLTFSGTNSGTTPPFGNPAQLNIQSLRNFAARVRFQPNVAIPFAGIGLDNLCVFWDVSESGWVIDYKKDGNWFDAVIRHVPFGEDWVLAVVDNLVLFYVDGSQVFAYQMTEVGPAGLLTMYLSGPGSFEELVISVDPQLSLRFTDGAGQLLQQLFLVDNETVVIDGVLPDVLRRPQRRKNTVMLDVKIVVPSGQPPLLPGPDQVRVIGDVNTYLAGATNQPVTTLADYVALAPPPFSQVAYETSPLARPVKLAQPGIAIDSATHVRTIEYAQYVPNSIMKGLGFDAASINYLLISMKDENGVNSYSLFNVSNQLLAQQVEVTPAGQTQKQFNSQKFFYDGAGNLTVIQPPNFFTPPSSSQSQDWVVTRAFTFLNQLQSVTTPDTGQTQYKYDSIGRLHFVLDANGAALNPQRILYIQYDALDRVIETGFVQSASLSWSDIPQYAEFPLPPNATPVWSNRYNYDNNCVDATDFEACPQADNLIGRLWRAQTNSAPSATPDVEIFSYDRRGHILIINSAVARYDANTYQSAFRYNNLDQLIETTYPRPLVNGQPIGDEFKVGRFFDRLGRLIGVGEHPRGNEVFDPTNPISGSPYAEKYAAFDYNFQNLVGAGRFNNASPASVIHRGYVYDVASRPTQINGDYHNQELTYETGGFNGAGYFNGQIASSRTTYFAAAGTDRFRAPVLSESRWAYAYDNLGRLLVAANPNQTVDSALNFGGTIPAVYDANGNLLTVPRGAATENYSYQPPTFEPDNADQ